jgi:hypothetical protein
MKMFLFLATLSVSYLWISFTPKSNTHEKPQWQADDCHSLSENARPFTLSGIDHITPLFTAGDIIIGNAILDTALINEITVLQCVSSLKKYGYIGVNGAIEFNTRQKFETTNSRTLRKKYKKIRGKISFALNGYLFTRSSFMIAKNAVNEIEIIPPEKTAHLDPRFKNSTCINIWTLTPEQRHEKDRIR